MPRDFLRQSISQRDRGQATEETKTIVAVWPAGERIADAAVVILGDGRERTAAESADAPIG